jgi:hypothetical protein
MCLAEGITPSNLLKKGQLYHTKLLTYGCLNSCFESILLELNIVDSETMSSTAIREALLTPGFVPPRSEIGKFSRYYTNYIQRM